MSESVIDVSTHTTCSLLNLPWELRRQIYSHVFNPYPSTTIVTSSYIKSDVHGNAYIVGTSRSKPTVDFSIVYANKQLHAETLPILLDYLHVYISIQTSQSHSVRRLLQPDLNECLPDHVLKTLRTVTYRLPTTNRAGYECPQPPKESFPFYSTPSLTKFCLRKVYHVDVSMLRSSTGNDRISYQHYDSMNPLKKMQCWHPTGFTDARTIIGYVARYGSGGWISALTMPETYGRLSKIINASRRPGVFSMFGAVTVYPVDISPDADADDDPDESGLGIPAGCELYLEVEVMLYTGSDYERDHVETMNVIVDLKRKEVTDVKFKKCIECQRGATMIMNFRDRRRSSAHCS